jgi:hypothetical protein
MKISSLLYRIKSILNSIVTDIGKSKYAVTCIILDVQLYFNNKYYNIFILFFLELIIAT